MENEFMKRGYLLPKGCKDLHDVLLLKQKQVASLFQCLPALPTGHDAALKPWKQPAPPPVTAQIVIGPHTTVGKLATLLGLKPFQIIGDLMKLGMFATADYQLDFETISKIARTHGFMAIKSA